VPDPNVDSEKGDKVPFAHLDKKQKLAILTFLGAYPTLFPHLFDITTFPGEVNESLSEVISNIGVNIPLPHTPYELWEKAVALWKSKAEE
jgi:hypothetical protein